MAFKKEIVDLAKLASQRKGYKTDVENFSSQDVQESLREELKKYVGNYYDFQKNKIDLFELLAENIDVIVPARIEARMGQFAEVVTLPQGARKVFKRKLGRLRARQFVGRVSPAGIYEAFRLDTDQFEVSVHSAGGGIRIDWERFLDGTDSWTDLLDILTEGMEYDVYKEIALELNGSYNASGRPANTIHSGAGFDVGAMRDMISTIRAYGDGAVIFATAPFIASMGDAVVYSTGNTPSVSVNDIEELRTSGRISLFYGAPIVEIPNAFVDETNTTWQLDNQYAYVLPVGGEKIVKVVFEGGTIVNDIGQQPGDMSMEMHTYKKYGTAVLFTNNWGIYKNTSLA